MKRASNRSDDEWMALVTACRQSGLSDRAWCSKQGVPPSSFYNAVKRLRNKACSIPEQTNSAPVFDLTAPKQEAVPISIVPENDSDSADPDIQAPSIQNLGSLYTIEIKLPDTLISLGNAADPLLVEEVLRILRRPLC